MKHNLKKFSTFTLASLFLGGCGAAATSSSTVTMNIKNLSSGTTSSSSLNLMEGFGSVGSFVTGTDYGSAAVGTGGLESFKLYITSIQFCNSLTVSGTAYSNTSGCSTVYSNDADSGTFTTTSAASAGTGKYFDILSATDRASLTTSASITNGTYNYGLVNWKTPVKITATVPRTNGSLKTTGCASYDTTTGACVQTNFTGTLAESIVDLNNGGTWFKFLKPFTADGTSTNVDLAFDLEDRIFGGKDVSNGGIQTTTVCPSSGGTSCGIMIPILKLVPIPRGSTESTMVETYDMTPPSSEWKLRVDVYYNSADTEKTVLAADVFAIPTTAIASSIAAGVYVMSVETSGTTTTFKNWDGTTGLVFTRGASGSGTLTCPSGATLAGCTAGSTATVTWSSRTIRTL